MPLTRNHRSTPYLNDDYALLVSGQLNITGFGSAAAALFNGTYMEPLILASTADGSPGSISQVFTSNTNILGGNRKQIPYLTLILVLTGLFRRRSFSWYSHPRCPLCSTRHRLPHNLNRHHPQSHSATTGWIQDRTQRALCGQAFEHPPGTSRGSVACAWC